MSGELTVADRRYEAILEKMEQSFRKTEVSNLKHYHKLGQHVSEFILGQETSKYGSATVERLAADLQERKVLESIRDPRRFLYWAKNVYDFDPSFERLAELASMGFTVTHAKIMYAASDEMREAMQAELIQDGKVISSRALQELCKELGNRMITASAQSAAEQARIARESGDADYEEEDEEVAADAAEAAEEAVGEAIENVSGVENVAGEAEQAQEAARDDGIPEGAGRTGRPTVPDRQVGNPLKTLSNVEKGLTKANSEIPNAFIVLRETAQVGFDSDAAQRRYVERLTALKSTLQGIQEPLQELLINVDQELTANQAAPTE